MSRQYMTTPEAAKYTRRSVRSIIALTARSEIPFRRIAGTRANLYLADELDAWIDGAPLEVVCDNGSKVVKVKGG